MKARSLLVLLVAALALVSSACGSSGGSDSGSKTTTTKAADTTTTTKASSGTTMASTDTTAASSGGAPTDAQVSAAVQKAFNVSATRGDCAAPKLRKAVSAKSLMAIADGKQDEIPSGELDTVKTALQDALAACP